MIKSSFQYLRKVCALVAAALIVPAVTYAKDIQWDKWDKDIKWDKWDKGERGDKGGKSSKGDP